MTKKSTPTKISRKVTAFVLRYNDDQLQILLINHPNTDYQLPAGTVKKKESFDDAVLREVEEETGLNDVSIFSSLDSFTREYRKKARVLKGAKIYSRPKKSASKFGIMRKGYKVKLLAESGDFYQIRYRERDNSSEDRPVMLEIIGWVKKNRLTKVEQRSFYILKTNDTRTQPWTNFADHHKFILEWHNLKDLPQLATKQKRWLDKYFDQLKL